MQTKHLFNVWKHSIVSIKTVLLFFFWMGGLKGHFLFVKKSTKAWNPCPSNYESVGCSTEIRWLEIVIITPEEKKILGLNSANRFVTDNFNVSEKQQLQYIHHGCSKKWTWKSKKSYKFEIKWRLNSSLYYYIKMTESACQCF